MKLPFKDSSICFLHPQHLFKFQFWLVLPQRINLHARPTPCLYPPPPLISQAKKLVENALLSKLQEAQAQVEETQAALAVSEDRAAALEMDRTRQGAAVSALTKQLQDANRSGGGSGGASFRF